jgi:hypothetical protein
MRGFDIGVVSSQILLFRRAGCGRDDYCSLVGMLPQPRRTGNVGGIFR